jgi:nucleolar protein 53
MSGIGRPQSNTQKSKKGRRSWRKNVDISDIETKLQEQREEIIQHGKLLADVESEDLFIIDEDADDEIEKKLKKDNIKKLKSSEILENKSKVPALLLSKIGKSKKNKRSDKIQGVDKKEMVHLLKLAGKIKGYDKTDERMAKEGIINSKAYDVWNTPLENEIKQNKLPNILKEKSSISFTKATVVPKTIKEAPIQVRKIEILPHAGKSYNPSFDNWKHLIEQEYFKEKNKEDQRLELEEYRDRIQYLISNYEDNEVEEDDDSENSDDNEKEEEAEEVEVEETKEIIENTIVEDGNIIINSKVKLSINPITEVKIKTKTQRNKEKRYKERKRLENELKEIKSRIKELEKLPEILQQVGDKEQKIIENINKEDKHDRLVRKGKKKLGSRFEVIEGPIEIKLSNELSDSLRKLKPEGNLLYDQMKNLQSKGMIETRRITKGKKGKKKVTEKWSYKDFK